MPKTVRRTPLASDVRERRFPEYPAGSRAASGRQGQLRSFGQNDGSAVPRAPSRLAAQAASAASM